MFYLGVCFACGTCPGSCSCPSARSRSDPMVSRSLEAVSISRRPMFSETPCISVVRNQNYRDDVSNDDPLPSPSGGAGWSQSVSAGQFRSVDLE